MLLLIPWWCTWEYDGQGYAGQGEPAERFGKYGGCRGRGEDEDEGGAHRGRAEVANAVREPSQHVQDGVGVRGKDVGKIGTVQDVLERGQDFDPNVRAVLYRDVATVDFSSAD